ncbi:MAG: VUT family protein [Planctomycetota bacterium]|nr:MAG: VUT family protein [Planctomycetota bacterium]
MSLPYEYVDANLHERRERVFLVLAGIFIGAMAMLNIIGITRFVHIGPLALAVGVLPYPLTFLCTDLIGELYGRRRANAVVWVGLLVNLLVIGTMWLGHMMPAVPSTLQPPWQTLALERPTFTPSGRALSGEVELFAVMYACTSGAVLASMVAYLAAQFCDVYLFHFWKRLTRGRHLWLRNNGSTLVSQFVDSVAVISITFGMQVVRGDMPAGSVLQLLWSNYAFKLVAALADTLPFYVGVKLLSRYLRINPLREHEQWDTAE